MNELLDIGVIAVAVLAMCIPVALIIGALAYAAAKWVKTMWDEEL